MHPIAAELNQIIQAEQPSVWNLLSPLGQRLFFPRGIVSQSAEATEKANHYNVTIGMAMENNDVMVHDYAMDYFNDFKKKEIFPYAGTAGLPQLLDAWRKKQYRQNPDLKSSVISRPTVTAAITHGLFVISELFTDKDDTIVLPDLNWGNYRLIFHERYQAQMKTFPLFKDNGFNLEGFAETINSHEGEKLIVILNFPNNPTGYSPLTSEMLAIRDILVKKAETTRILVICDDAYFGLFYSPYVYPQSPFVLLANAHPNLLAVKLDAATKEDFFWGLRVGFITYGIKNGSDELYRALIEKTKGSIRGSVSNNSMFGQSLLLRYLNHPDYEKSKTKKIEILQTRAKKTEEVAHQARYRNAWEALPFNSGYFMCLKLLNTDAEQLRVFLLEKKGIGTISINSTVLRIAFSSIDYEQIPDLFEEIYQSIGEMNQQ